MDVVEISPKEVESCTSIPWQRSSWPRQAHCSWYHWQCVSWTVHSHHTQTSHILHMDLSHMHGPFWDLWLSAQPLITWFSHAVYIPVFMGTYFPSLEYELWHPITWPEHPWTPVTEGTACRLSPLLGYSESIQFGEYRHYNVKEHMESERTCTKVRGIVLIVNACWNLSMALITRHWEWFIHLPQHTWWLTSAIVGVWPRRLSRTVTQPPVMWPDPLYINHFLSLCFP